ncbi:Nif3-like dinuclear metal center hexameric protein [Marinomonas sp. 2405UD68-3]|uniref:Nif3-like dinuclear metal center hexameric protein n=1 Tax=Marinomonas sp. 2405UD68-3 TaxID=3391835 RepID=UPI0039C980E4
MKREKLNKELNAILNVHQFKDYAPNGLQVEGTTDVKRIVTGVTASQALIDKAIELNADTIIVHHGYFWKGESYSITGMKYRRIAALIKNDINLFAYHLPLDAHPVLGNNAGLAGGLGLSNRIGLQRGVELEDAIGLVGELPEALTGDQFSLLIKQVVGRDVLFEMVNDRKIKKVALCTGGAQGYIEQAAEMGADVYITGEVSEKTIHIAREMDIHFCAAGHHATERFGPMLLAEHLKSTYQLDVFFVDIDNPA